MSYRVASKIDQTKVFGESQTLYDGFDIKQVVLNASLGESLDQSFMSMLMETTAMLVDPEVQRLSLDPNTSEARYLQRGVNEESIMTLVALSNNIKTIKNVLSGIDLKTTTEWQHMQSFLTSRDATLPNAVIKMLFEMYKQVNVEMPDIGSSALADFDVRLLGSYSFTARLMNNVACTEGSVSIIDYISIFGNNEYLEMHEELIKFSLLISSTDAGQPLDKLYPYLTSSKHINTINNIEGLDKFKFTSNLTNSQSLLDVLITALTTSITFRDSPLGKVLITMLKDNFIVKQHESSFCSARYPTGWNTTRGLSIVQPEEIFAIKCDSVIDLVHYTFNRENMNDEHNYKFLSSANVLTRLGIEKIKPTVTGLENWYLAHRQLMMIINYFKSDIKKKLSSKKPPILMEALDAQRISDPIRNALVSSQMIYNLFIGAETKTNNILKRAIGHFIPVTDYQKILPNSVTFLYDMTKRQRLLAMKGMSILKRDYIDYSSNPLQLTITDCDIHYNLDECSNQVTHATYDVRMSNDPKVSDFMDSYEYRFHDSRSIRELVTDLGTYDELVENYFKHSATSQTTHWLSPMMQRWKAEMMLMMDDTFRLTNKVVNISQDELKKGFRLGTQLPEDLFNHIIYLPTAGKISENLIDCMTVMTTIVNLDKIRAAWNNTFSRHWSDGKFAYYCITTFDAVMMTELKQIFGPQILNIKDISNSISINNKTNYLTRNVHDATASEGTRRLSTNADIKWLPILADPKDPGQIAIMKALVYNSAYSVIELTRYPTTNRNRYLLLDLGLTEVVDRESIDTEPILLELFTEKSVISAKNISDLVPLADFYVRIENLNDIRDFHMAITKNPLLIGRLKIAQMENSKMMKDLPEYRQKIANMFKKANVHTPVISIFGVNDLSYSSFDYEAYEVPIKYDGRDLTVTLPSASDFTPATDSTEDKSSK